MYIGDPVNGDVKDIRAKISDGFEIDVGGFVNNDDDDHGVEGETSFNSNDVMSSVISVIVLLMRMMKRTNIRIVSLMIKKDSSL